MIKNDLPVMILKGLVLLPLSEARIELNNDISKKVIDMSRNIYSNMLLLVTPSDSLEEEPDTNDLPLTAVAAKITTRMDLANGNTRIVLSGVSRYKVLSYYKSGIDDDVLLANIVEFPKTYYNEVEETTMLRVLNRELENYISVNPNISNSIISQIKGVDNLDKLTDYVGGFLPLNNEKRMALMLDSNRMSRAKKLIEEIHIELAILTLENKIDDRLRNSLDDMQKEMILKEKINVIKKELGENNSKDEFIEEINKRLEKENIPENIVKRIKKELDRYDITLDNNPESSVIRNYIDTVMSIPFDNFTKDEKNLKKIEDSLNETHYGLEKVKERILENVAVRLNNENALVPAICLIGPPGIGKTSLAESIAKALKRNFTKISLGGISDPQELIGHRKTYLGSEPGKIINSIIRSESINPVILLDEIDKVSADYKGDPTNVLLDLLDSKQSSSFTDNFIEEKVDLSKVLFILTANDINQIPLVLLDRLDVIVLDSYLDFEKESIANNYLIKKALKNSGIKDNLITFDKGAIDEIINSYTKESGVRNLDRLINRIIKKIITESKISGKKIEKTNITKKDIQKYLGEAKYLKKDIKNERIGYVKGLAYTPLGGETLEIEVTSYEGKEAIVTSGHLGETLKESIMVSLGYIKANMKKFGINKEEFDKTIHINFREGAVLKEGPSAGIMITTAIISYLINKSVPLTISGTGEMTLLGDVLAVGGLREKCLSASKNGVKKVYLSKDNKSDIEELPKEIKSRLEFVFIDNYIELFNDLFKK